MENNKIHLLGMNAGERGFSELYGQPAYKGDWRQKGAGGQRGTNNYVVVQKLYEAGCHGISYCRTGCVVYIS